MRALCAKYHTKRDWDLILLSRGAIKHNRAYWAEFFLPSLFRFLVSESPQGKMTNVRNLKKKDLFAYASCTAFLSSKLPTCAKRGGWIDYIFGFHRITFSWSNSKISKVNVNSISSKVYPVQI
jgi:hypothetical protein